VFVDALPNCNDLILTNFITQIDLNWMIKVSQLSCSSPNLPPSGCLQYFFGQDQGIVASFNSGGIHLANQQQVICVRYLTLLFYISNHRLKSPLINRREADTCRICWSPVTSTDFQLSGPGSMAITDDNLCCAYGLGGLDDRGFDCLLVAGASNAAGVALKAARFCGSGKGLATLGTQSFLTALPLANTAGVNKSICCKNLNKSKKSQ